MDKAEKSAISFFEKNLTYWVALCMVCGVLIGKFMPGIPKLLAKFEYANVSIPIAVLIWLMILIAFTPIVAFLLGIGGVTIPWMTLMVSVVLFVVVPLVGGVLTRNLVIRSRGEEYFQNTFIPKFNNITIAGLGGLREQNQRFVR